MDREQFAREFNDPFGAEPRERVADMRGSETGGIRKVTLGWREEAREWPWSRPIDGR